MWRYASPFHDVRSTSRARFVALLMALALPAGARAAEAAPGPVMTRALEQYAQAWREPDVARREALLKAAWAQDGRYRDPTVTLAGIDALSRHIGEFRSRYPNATVDRTSRIDAYDNVFRVHWRVSLGDGSPAIEGQDTGTFAEDGHIASITGFFGALPVDTGDNAKLVNRYFENLFIKFDQAALDGIVAPGAVYHQAAGLPYGGEYVGFPAWMTMFQKSVSYVGMQLLAPPALFSEPSTGRVLATFDVRITSKKAGWEMVMPVAEWFDIKDGKIASIRPYYFDTRTLAAKIAEDQSPQVLRQEKSPK